MPRGDTVDHGGHCDNSDQCNDLADFCFVGDRRCLSQAECDSANADCTPMPKTQRWNFTNIDKQFCMNITNSHKFGSVTDLDACKAHCGNSCNAFALGPTGCTVFEGCSASVVWGSHGDRVYMKDISSSFTRPEAGSSCTFVQYNEP